MQVVILELAAPGKTVLRRPMSGRNTGYFELVDAYRTNGWRACCEQIEVGCKISLAISAPGIQAPWYQRGLQERKATRNIT